MYGFPDNDTIDMEVGMNPMLAGLLFSAAAAAVLPSQQIVTSPQTSSVSSGSARRVTLDLQGVSLAEALRSITRQSGARIVYAASVVPLNHRVSVEGSNMSVNDALAL